MITASAVIGSAALLMFEGELLCRALGGGALPRVVRWSLGYPLGALLNALLLFAVFAVRLPITAASILAAHVLVIAALALLVRRMPLPISDALPQRQSPSTVWTNVIMAVCVVSIAAVAIASIVYALDLPVYYWDSFTNWHMRSLQMLQAHTLLFHGVEKPQYPILIHGLHMLPGLVGWSGRAANAMTLLLSLSSFTALLLLMRRSFGWRTALVTLALLLAVPLAVIHLRQGYADIHVASYLLLSAFLLGEYMRERRAFFLRLSLVLCIAAAWTKLEGLYIGLGAWMAVVAWDILTSREARWTDIRTFLSFVVLALIWPVTILTRGLRLSPDGGGLEWHGDLLPLLLSQTFLRGSFGVHWFAIAAILLLLLSTRGRKEQFLRLRTSAPLLVGLVSLVAVVFIYLCTAGVRGLIDQNGFSRTMLIPTLLLTMALSLRGCALFFGDTDGEMAGEE